MTNGARYFQMFFLEYFVNFQNILENDKSGRYLESIFVRDLVIFSQKNICGKYEGCVASLDLIKSNVEHVSQPVLFVFLFFNRKFVELNGTKRVLKMF